MFDSPVTSGQPNPPSREIDGLEPQIDITSLSVEKKSVLWGMTTPIGGIRLLVSLRQKRYSSPFVVAGCRFLWASYISYPLLILIITKSWCSIGESRRQRTTRLVRAEVEHVKWNENYVCKDQLPADASPLLLAATIDDIDYCPRWGSLSCCCLG